MTSAGNSGSNSWGVVTVPANADSVFTVGAVNINKEYANFSSRGTPSVNSTLKPNVVGVGKHVYLVKEDGTVGISNGTSFSAPQITGLVSCLMEAFPGKKNWELKAAIEGLKVLNESCLVHITTDSKYVMDGITQWIQNWKKNNWRTASKKDVKNKELWQKLDELISYHQVQWHWVKGHSGDIGNETADILANKGIDSIL